MRRRKLLGAVGLGATGMAGLLGGGRANGAGQDTETGTTTTTTGTATTTAGGDGTGIDSDAERPFARISVGTREGVRNPENNQAHLVRVWNDSQQARTIELVLTRSGGGGGDGGGGGEAGDGERPLLDREVEFPADGYLTMRLLEPASYRLRVRLGGASPAEIRIPRARFDCNDSRTDVTVTPDGRVNFETVTTEEGCPPEVTDRTFTALAGSCGSENRASVSVGDESVTVRGAIQVPNPCYGARLADVAVADGDTLRLTVTPTEPTAAFCAQCIAHVRYRAELAFRDRVPGTVEVVYRRDGETETVARATRNAGGGTTTNEGGTTTGAGDTTTTTGTSDTTTGQQTTATGTTETS